MDPDDHFFIKQESFESEIKTSWKELQADNDFCDITLACEGKQIKTHKIVISSYSPVLRNILKLSQNPLIYLCKIKYKDLINMLQYMYQGEVDVANSDISSFLELAEELEIRGLSKGPAEINTLKRKTAPQSTTQDFEHSTKRIVQRTVESKKTAKIIDEIQEPIDSHNAASDISEENIVETKNPLEIQNPNESNTSIKLEEIKSEVLKFETIKHEDNDQGAVSTTWRHVLTCPKCSKQFFREQALKAHIISIHEGIWEYCHQCDYKAQTISHLKQHVQAIHEGIRYSCSHCDYQTTKTYTLKRHVQALHEGVRYPCNQCDYTSKWKNEYNLHMKRVHQQLNVHSYKE